MKASISPSNPASVRTGGFRSPDELHARERLNNLLNGEFLGRFDHLDDLGERLLKDDVVEGTPSRLDCLDRALAEVMEGELSYFQDAQGIWVFRRPHLS
jgi:hypothetical protein